MIRVEVGQRVQDPETGMVGTVVRTWNMSVAEWWIEVRWDNSTTHHDNLPASRLNRETAT